MKNLSPVVSVKHAPVALNSRFTPATAARKPVSMPAQLVKRTSFNQVKQPSADVIQQAIAALIASDKLCFDNMCILECWQYFIESKMMKIQTDYMQKWMTEKVTFVLDYFNISQVGALAKDDLVRGLITISLKNAFALYNENTKDITRLTDAACIEVTGWTIDALTYRQELAFIEQDVLTPFLAKLHDAAYPATSDYAVDEYTNCFEQMGHSMEWAAYYVRFVDTTKTPCNFFFYPFFYKSEVEDFIDDVLKPQFPNEKFAISAHAWIDHNVNMSMPHSQEYMAKMADNYYFQNWLSETQIYKNSDKYQQIIKAEKERLNAIFATYKQQQGVH